LYFIKLFGRCYKKLASIKLQYKVAGASYKVFTFTVIREFKLFLVLINSQLIYYFSFKVIVKCVVKNQSKTKALH